jgi:hypothetical protein
MATTLNGWPAITSATSNDLRTITIPGTKKRITVQKDAAPLFAAFYADWERRMPNRMKLENGMIACWNYRYSRYDTKALSNHASATAVDCLNDTVLPADGQAHMTSEEKAILDDILSLYVTDDGHRVLANGEWWNTPHKDGMHTELSQAWDRYAKRNTTLADVRNVINRLGIDKDGNRKKDLWDGIVPVYDNILYAEDHAVANPAAWRLACRLADLGFFQGTPINGIQKYPAKGVAAWQKSIGAKDTGIYGPKAHDGIFPGDQSNIA